MSEHQEKLDSLVDGIGSFIEYWGFRRIHGRVWARVYISDRPLSTPEIVSSLNVSKALISSAINELLEHKLITRVGQVKFGGITYVACSNPAEVVRDIVRNRELILFEKIQANLEHVEKFNTLQSDELGINQDSIKNLKNLTSCHRKIAQKLCEKNIKTIDEWISFIKKISRFAV